MSINASLFAHIENDSSLSGTYGLQGHRFINTTQYLKDYLEEQMRSGEPVPAEYLKLLQNTDYLVTVEKQLDTAFSNQQPSLQIDAIVDSIVGDLSLLNEGEKLLIPGGWHNSDGGHAMIYQFSRGPDGYLFTVYNSGAGIQYHSKKSSEHKELYNPMKTWSVPLPTTDKGNKEIGHFIKRLLNARQPVAAGQQKKPTTDKVLYEEILPSISYIKGKEEDANVGLPDYCYTGAQLSGTCAQRSIHQMLKISSRSAEAYQRFIFKFKQHALFDYANSCVNGQEPFTPAVSDQISLAIDNNLKILNTPKLFTPIEIEEHFNKLISLKSDIGRIPFRAASIRPAIRENIPPLVLIDHVLAAPRPPLGSTTHGRVSARPIDIQNGKKLLANMAQFIQDIEQITDHAMLYMHLEKLILSLPITINGRFKESSFYAELQTLENYKTFEKHLNALQHLLLTLQEEWLKKAQTPSFNIIALSVLSLQVDTHQAITNMRGLPSFMSFDHLVMESLISNHDRDPFLATNKPALDQRIKMLQSRFGQSGLHYNDEFYRYLNILLDTEMGQKSALESKYHQSFGSNISELHSQIRRNKLEALFMISLHLKNPGTLEAIFNPIIEKIKEHLEYEAKLRRAINPFYVTAYEASATKLDVGIVFDSFRVSTTLYPTFVAHEKLLKVITTHKYNLDDSPARDALEADIFDLPISTAKSKIKTANHIQLNRVKASNSPDALQHVSQADIIARDYHHIRANPSVQVTLTLDYFTRHISKLADESNQRYVEANLFQPGLLLNALEEPTFLAQFDVFLKNGLRFFTDNGQHTHKSLFFLRQDFLVSRYLSLATNPAGLSRLKAIQDNLVKQLKLSENPDVIYALQQTLFMSIMAQVDIIGVSAELFALAFNSYFYLNGHTNPRILEDTSHRIDVDCAMARFQILASLQPEDSVRQSVENTLLHCDQPRTHELKIRGQFPVYNLVNKDDTPVYEVNVILGKLFDNKLARSGVPLAIQNHPLIKKLGLHDIRECLMSADATYMILPTHEKTVRFFYIQDRLTVQKDWFVQGRQEAFELQALSFYHLAQKANAHIRPVLTSLPKLLCDDSMDYWKSTTRPGCGILVQGNVPVYVIENKQFIALDQNGRQTPYQLKTPDQQWRTILNAFESNDFILGHEEPNHMIIHLPRFELSFTINKQIPNPVLMYQETGEQVIECNSPIHPAVACLVLKRDEQERCLIPVERFYATEQGAVQGDVYPVIHDIKGVIADSLLNEQWKSQPPLNKPMWRYQKSETYVSFQLKDHEPIADSSADALYLVYIYLATNQTEKAWKTLEDCHARLGGLTGNPAELKYIDWICNDLPHLLPSDRSDYERLKPMRQTPPYIACQLKATSLLCDYLSQDRTFELKAPSVTDNTANTHYALLEHQRLELFLKSLPNLIYERFRRLQTMGRHIPHTYNLSHIERRRLLDHYHRPNAEGITPLGALGYEAVSLSLEAILNERVALLAQKTSGNPLSSGDEKRLTLINRHLTSLKPVIALSTIIEHVEIDLSLPITSDIRITFLNEPTKLALTGWKNNLPGVRLGEEALQITINSLSSITTEDELIGYFPACFQVACSSNESLRKPLLDFCSDTLLAKRHISLSNQESNNALLCNILYRILNNTEAFNRFLTSQTEPLKLTKLIQTINTYSIQVLKVYQEKDIYHDILARTEDIVARIKHPTHRPLVTSDTPATPLILQMGIKKYLDDALTPQHLKMLIDIINNYQLAQDNAAHAIAALGETLTQDPEQAINIEEQAGQYQLRLERHQKTLAKQLIEEPGIVGAIKRAAQFVKPIIETELHKAWSVALTLANQGPDDRDHLRTWTIEKESKTRPTLTKAQLMSIYTRADCAYSIETTGLSLDNVQRLHDLIHKALLTGIVGQTLEKMVDSFEKACEKQDASIAVQALDLLAKPNIPAVDEPAIVLLQHEEHILLRERQVTAIKALLEESPNGQRFNELIEKITMGGGKSKVILPILAEKKARGDNLVVVEVPHALLATNHVDLNRTSQRLFNKRAYRFEFKGDSNCSPERLEQLYQHFTEIMTTRSYLVTTGESIQSLQLTYLRLLLSSKTRNKTWENQVYWCDKIIGLFRHHADCIIDEVHQGLWIKKKLIYTTGEPVLISPSLIKNAVALYGFIDIELIKKAPSLDDDFDWTDFKTTLATRLTTPPTGPLCQFVSDAILRHGPDAQAEIIAYLSNRADTMSKAVLFADAEDKASLAYFKQEINVLLPQTLRRRRDEHYGPSKRKSLSPNEQTLAIPYAANNVPNEDSRFGNELEAMNYTIQMMVIKGISKALLIEQIALWQASARQELFQNKGIAHLDDTPTARGFALQAGRFNTPLSQVNIEDVEQMEALHALLQHHRPLIFDLLGEQSLKQIHHDTTTIHSDTFNHVDLYRSVQGISGTPSNNTTFHQRLRYNKTASLGADGYIIEMIHEKNTAISSLDYQDVFQFVGQALSQSLAGERVRAIIDINATFQGVSNVFVAKEIARYIHANPNHFNRTITQVLYFNDDQVLCAINIHKPEEPMLLATSDAKEIDRLLNTTPGERLSYYDQAHTIGTDIKQDEHAHALVLTDEKTSLQAFLQGSMRMRELSQNQTIELIVPKRLEGITRSDLIKRFAKSDQQMLLSDNLFAAKAGMTNLIRHQFISLIQDLPSDDFKGKLALTQHFKAFFEDTPSTDLFELYGAINKKQATRDILSRCQKQLITLWSHCLTSAGLAPSESDKKTMSLRLQTIIEQATPNCLAEYEGIDDSMSMEVEVQKEVLKEETLQTTAINECYNASRSEVLQKSWPYNLAHIYTPSFPLKDFAISLNKLCSHGDETPGLFSETLMTSRNYAETYTEEQNYVGAFLKPVFLVWYHITAGQLHAMIITPQEATDLIQCISGISNSWLSTTQDHLIKGQRPLDILENKDYQSLREQVRFFNGEFGELLTQETPLCWIKEQPIEKFHFFEHRLLAHRPGSSLAMQHLKVALTQLNNEGFIHIAKHPFENLSRFDWKTLFPKILPAQVAEYKKVAMTFVYLNQNWMNKSITLDELQQQFRIPLNGLDIVSHHLNFLITLKGLILNLPYTRPLKSFLLNRSEKERLCLEKCLGMPLVHFYEQHGITPPELWPNFTTEELTTSWQLADIQAFHILRAHPAITNKTLIDQYLLSMVEKATSKDVLHLLLKTTDMSEEMKLAIIRHPLGDDVITNLFLGAPYELSEDLLIILAEKCHSNTQVDLLLQRPGLTDDIFKTLLDLPDLTEAQLLRMINQARNNDILEIIFSREAITKPVREALYQHRLLSPAALLSFASNRFHEVDEVLLLLNHPSAVSEKTLGTLALRIDITPEVLLSIVSHVKANQHVMRCVAQHDLFSPAIAKTMLERQAVEPDLDTLKIIANKTCAQVLMGVLHNPEWDNCLAEVFLQFTRMNASAELTQLLNEGALWGNVIVETLLHLPADLNDAMLAILAQKCRGNAQVDLLLERPNLTDNMFKTLLAHPDLTEPQLSKVIRQARSGDVIELIFSYNTLTKPQRMTLYQHPLLPPKSLWLFVMTRFNEMDEVLQLLNHPSAVTEDILNILAARHPNTSQVLLSIISHAKANQQVMSNVVQNSAFSAEMAHKMLEQQARKINPELLKQITHKTFDQWALCKSESEAGAWENSLVRAFETFIHKGAKKELIDLIAQKSLNQTLIIAIARLLGEAVLGQLPLNHMLATATKEQLDPLINLKAPLSADNVLLLAEKTQHALQINALLARPEMTSPIADVLLKKSEYNGHVGDWAWITEKQVLIMLDKSKDFIDFNRALTHKHLSEHQRKQWFIDIQLQQKTNSNKAMLSTDQQQKIVAVLDKLKVKACSHAIKALKVKQYEQVAKTAFGLYHDLLKEVEQHFNSPAPNTALFQTRCKDMISAASPVLDMHRGYKQLILDILNVLLVCLILRFDKFKGDAWRFFKADTASHAIVKKVSASLEESAKEPLPLHP